LASGEGEKACLLLLISRIDNFLASAGNEKYFNLLIFKINIALMPSIPKARAIVKRQK
jgi:hypothetical protein